MEKRLTIQKVPYFIPVLDCVLPLVHTRTRDNYHLTYTLLITAETTITNPITDKMAELENAEYTLYSSPFSLYSMMARHTIQLGRASSNARPPKSITLHFINHRKDKNLEEEYLKVNPKGQVPAMTGNVLEHPLTDSISISLYLAENHYPALLPPEHAAVIKDLLQRFHSIYGLSFSNPKPTAEMKQYNPSPVEGLLKRTDISPEYRKLLEGKLKLYVTRFILRLSFCNPFFFFPIIALPYLLTNSRNNQSQ